MDVALSGNHAYLTGWPVGLQVIDISHPADSQRFGGYDTSGFALEVAVSGNHAYVANRDGSPDAGLQVIDIRDPANPLWVGGYYQDGAWDVGLSGGFAYVTIQETGLLVLDITNPASPKRVGKNTSFKALGLQVSGDRVFVASGTEGMWILDSFPARLEAIPDHVQGAFRLRVQGTPGRSVLIQRSANLKDWQDWMPVRLISGSEAISDSEAPAQAQRFYRAVTP